jgi:hypothetical protein
VYCCHSVLPCQDTLAKCFTNSSKKFQYQVMFEKKHTFFS